MMGDISAANSDLVTLAQRLLRDGPEKTFSTPRRVRLVHNGQYIADTTSALFVWEKPYYPYYYVPANSLISNDHVKWNALQDIHVDGASGSSGKAGAQLYEVSVSNASASSSDKASTTKSTSRIIAFTSEAPKPLAGLVRVEFGAVDEWFEEDAPIFVHPKDPFKRVDVVASTRRIKVELDGVTLADTHYAMHLYETSLPTRYYLPFTAIPLHYLRASSTKTQCPYKGEAEYYDLVLPSSSGGEPKVYKDLVWYYLHPNLECAGIIGFACFYNEKVDVYIDGKKEERARTHMA